MESIHGRSRTSVGVGVLVILCIGVTASFALQLHVLDSGSKKPISGAEVTYLIRSVTVTASTDSHGFATVAAIGENVGVTITVKHPGHSPVQITFEGKPLPTDLEILLPEAQTIGGRVLDEAGRPVLGAEISVSIPQRMAGPRVPEQDLRVKTDGEGNWRCTAVPKDAAYVVVDVFHPDYESVPGDFPVARLQAGKAEMRLTRVLVVRGQVVGEAGSPIADAQVILGQGQMIWPGNDTPETRTDAQGYFEISRVHAGKHLLGVKADGWAPIVQEVEARPDLQPMQIKLRRGVPFRFLVVDQKMQPIRDAIARVDEWPSEQPEAGQWSYPGWEWRTDVAGQFVWTNCPPEPAMWSFSKAGFMSKGRLNVKPRDGEQTVVLTPAFRLTGTVSDAKTSEPVSQFILTPRFVNITAFGGRSVTNFGQWGENHQQEFKGGKFSVYYENPLLIGTAQTHAWQFRVEADGYAPKISRVINDEERGTNIDFRLEHEQIPEIAVAAPTGTNRVTASAIIQPNPASPGDSITVLVKLRIAPGHWIYSMDNSGSANLPTALVVPPWVPFRSVGNWRRPEPKSKEDGSKTYSGEVVFQHRFTMEPGAAEVTQKLPITISYQVCSEALCWPPATISLVPELNVVRSQSRQ
jgi:hypothetical protein